MDISTLLIGFVVTLIIASPIVLTGISRKKREKKLRTDFEALSKSKNSSIKISDFWSGTAIGINQDDKLLFFIRQLKEVNEDLVIDLKEFQRCNFIKITNKGDVVEKIEITFTPIVKNNSEVKLEIYNAEINPLLAGELSIAEKWVKLINETIKTHNPIKVTAA